MKYCQNNGLGLQQDTQLHRGMIVMQETSQRNLGTAISLEANHSLSALREVSNGGNDSNVCQAIGSHAVRRRRLRSFQPA